MRSDTDHVERPGAGDTDEAGSFANQRGAGFGAGRAARRIHKKDVLLGRKAEFSVDDRTGFGRTDQTGLEMGVTVIVLLVIQPFAGGSAFAAGERHPSVRLRPSVSPQSHFAHRRARDRHGRRYPGHRLQLIGDVNQFFAPARSDDDGLAHRRIRYGFDSRPRISFRRGLEVLGLRDLPKSGRISGCKRFVEQFDPVADRHRGGGC